jgi:hypothetical protein
LLRSSIWFYNPKGVFAAVSKDIKVTDKRMFTSDGELREEYRDLFEKSTGETAEEPAPATPRPSAAPPSPAPAALDFGQPGGPGSPEGYPPAGQPGWGFQEEPAGYGYEPGPPPLDLPSSGLGPEMGGGPTFFDLAAMLAEPVAVYLGDVPLPDGQSAENLEMAHLHIDLLDVLRQKTAGNLSAQEAAFFEDLLYRLKVRYVQKRR